MRRLAVLLAVVASMLLTALVPAAADGPGSCEIITNPWGVTLVCDDVNIGVNPGDPGTPGVPPGSYYEYAWTPACPSNVPVGNVIPQNPCANFYSCADPEEFLWALWARLIRMTNDGPEPGGWELVETTCEREKPTEGPPGAGVPTVTWQMVLSELRRVGLPAVTVQVQPEGETLVNFETIFFTEAAPFSRSLAILGRDVDVVASPSQFHWRYGDGASETTTTPGAPYPAKTIVHEYLDAKVTVRPSVDVVYAARFRVDGGAWQEIPETITIPGPAVDLRVREATPVLSGG